MPDTRPPPEGSYRRWSSEADPWGLKAPGYDYHVFLSYARSDLEAAGDLAESLVRNGLRVFWAHKSLSSLGLGPWGPDSPGGWSVLLQEALLRSCHFLGLLTPGYVATPWCDLEYLGFKNIRAVNPARNLILYQPDLRIEIPEMYAVSDALVATAEEATQLARRAVESRGVKLGNPLAPTTCFADLPLEQTEDGRWASFYDDSEQGTSIEPPRRLAVVLVRELMVRLRKGATEDQLLQDLEQLSRFRDHKWVAIRIAKTLLNQGVTPEGFIAEPRSPTPSVDPEASARLSPRDAPATKSAPVPPPPALPVWDISKSEDADWTFEAVCRRCGYSETFSPRGGDPPYPRCPQCGYDGRSPA